MQNVDQQSLRLQIETRTLEEMWEFIDSLIKPYPLVLDRSVLTHEQVLKIYLRLCEIDEMFREFEQIQILKEFTRRE